MITAKKLGKGPSGIELNDILSSQAQPKVAPGAASFADELKDLEES